MVERQHHLWTVHITKSVNKIASARLVYLDGAAATGDFPLSNTDLFIPGQSIEILAGTESQWDSLFQGVVVRQSLKIRDKGSSHLIVDCRHFAVKLTGGRKNAYFFEQTDSDTISALLEKAAIKSDVQATSVVHPQQVQYNATDWDFLLARAEANGQWVLTNDEKVLVKTPDFSGKAVCTLQFGATILELDAEVDARSQYTAVKSFTWDAAQQNVLVKEAVAPSVKGPGNLKNDELAAVIALDHYALQHVALMEEEAQTWADAHWLKSQMSKVSGLIKCEGIGTVNPGDIVTLSGIGKRYNGEVLVTGMGHDFDTMQGWKTHIQFGHTEQWFAETHAISAPQAGALLPGVSGLQIGIVVSNEDPEGEHRIRVRMPLVDNKKEGTWARVATLDAGKDRGFFFRPEIGDEVVLGFLNDDPRQAVILGMLHSSAQPAPLQGSEDNHEKVYQSRSKMKIYFNDEKKVMQFETPAGNKLTLNEDTQGILIEDQNGNKIAMTPEGIKIEGNKAIELKAGTEVKLESGTALTIKAGAELKLEGTSGAEISSTAIMKVKGSLVQIN